MKDLQFTYPGGGFTLLLTDLSVNSGESIAFTGPSGTGNSKLLHLAAEIRRPDAGSATLGTSALMDLSEKERRSLRLTRIGFVFQDFELLDYRNVRDNILLPARLGGPLRLDNTVRLRAGALAEEMGIADKLERLPDRLSKGERQRAAVCRAHPAESIPILADEATENLDPENRDRVLDILFRFVRETGARPVITPLWKTKLTET